MTYICRRNKRAYNRIRLEGGAKAWRGIPFFLRTESCWNCGLSDCPKNYKRYDVVEEE